MSPSSSTMSQKHTVAGGATTESTRLLTRRGGEKSGGGGTFSSSQEQQQQPHHNHNHRHQHHHHSHTRQQQPPQPTIAQFHHHSHLQQQQHQHAHIQHEADPVERMVKWSLVGFALFLLFFFVGVLFLVLKALGFDQMPLFQKAPPGLTSYWAVFTPFWIADLVGWVVVVRTIVGICSLRTVEPISQHERRNIGRVITLKRNAHRTTTTTTEMLPLVQILVRSVLAAMPFLICLTTAQVLLCLTWEKESSGSGGGGSGIPLWLAVLPITIWETLAFLGTLCSRRGSFIKAMGWFLTLLATVTLSLHFSVPSPLAKLSEAFAHKGLLGAAWIAFTPLWTLHFILLLTLLYVSIQSCCARRYRLTAHHVACLVLYMCSLALLTLASVLFAWRHDQWETNLDHALRFQNFSETLTGISLFCGVGLTELAFYLVAAEEVDHLITSHGYEDPVPLSRTARGWEPTGARVSTWFLLGRIEETARLMRRGVVAGAVGGVAGAGAGIMKAGARVVMVRGGVGVGESPLRGGGDALGGSGSGRGEGGGGELRRSNSGSYADLYDDL